MKRTGNRFEYFRLGRLWYWRLWQKSSPSSYPVAIGGHGYTSEKLVREAILTAQRSAQNAGDKITSIEGVNSAIIATRMQCDPAGPQGIAPQKKEPRI
jgi:hypothetical protein